MSQILEEVLTANAAYASSFHKGELPMPPAPQTIGDNAASVVEDVSRIRNHPLMPNEIPIYGYSYDVRTGELVDVPDAAPAGAANA